MKNLINGSVSIMTIFNLVMLIVVSSLHLQARKEMFCSLPHKPGSVKYDALYELPIEEGPARLEFFDFSRVARVTISHQGNDFSYGHAIDIKILGSDVSKTKVECQQSGITLQFDSDHSLFIPKKSFAGGR